MSDLIQNATELARRKLTTRVMAGRAFMIKTPPCQSYIRHMTTWLTTGSHGALVYGRPRLGKTSASRWMLKKLSEVVGYVPWVEIPVRVQRIASEREFFQHVLHCARHKHYLNGTAGDKRDRLAEWLVMRALRSPVNAAVLFIDEAQLLTEHHFEWLLNIGNELDARGCRLFCLLVGQADLVQKKTELIDHGFEQIVGRFMVREMEFPGICMETEQSDCLSQFNDTIYPAGGSMRFPASFIPKAVDGGFHLQSLSPAMWQSFEKEWLAAGFDGSPIVPMHYLTATLMGILNSQSKKDSHSLIVSGKDVNQCVMESGYCESLRAIKGTVNSPKPSTRDSSRNHG